MNFYFIFFTITLFLSLFCYLSKKNTLGDCVYTSPLALISVIYIILLLFLVSGFRYNVGTDYTAYMKHAETYILPYSFIEAAKESEIFFVLFSKLSYSVCGNMQLFYMIVALFISVFTIKGLLYFNKTLFSSLFIFFLSTCFFISLNVMRQMVVFSLFLYSIKYIEQRSFKKFLIIMLIGYCWHKCAIFYIPCYWLYKRINLEKFIYLFIIIMPLMKKLLNILVLNFLDKLGISMNYYFKLQEGASSKFFIVLSFIILMYFHFFVNKNNRTQFFINIAIIEYCICILADGIPGSYRLVYLFYPMYIVICPYAVKESKIYLYGKIFILFVILLFGYYFYSMQILANANGVTPYYWILNYR